MPDSLFSDSSLQAAKIALNGLSGRQQLISRNIANIDTPGYHAQDLNFEDALKNVFHRRKGLALETTSSNHLTSSSTSQASFSVSNRPGGSERADLNNVDIDVELTDMSQVGIQYQAVSQAVSKKLALLKAIANSR